ncbi:MAG: glucoamylase family protein [Bacteroidota bacterium]
MKYHRLISIILGSVCLLLSYSGSLAQAAYFFQDSNTSGYYDSGLAFHSGQSDVEQAGPSGDKIPTVSGQNVFQGDNSLRIRWTSKPGGDWLALVIAPGFPFQDLSQMDTISFWVYSDSGLSKSLLPNIYLEGAPGTAKSNQYSLSLFSDDIPQAMWTEMVIPLSVFVNDPNQTNIDFSQIKAIILGQGTADGEPHSLLIDEVKAYNGGSASQAVASPSSFQAKGYDSHVFLSWAANTEPHLGGYYLYQSVNNGADFQLRKILGPSDTIYSDFTREQGNNLQLKYKIAAVNIAGQLSPFSSELDVATYDMTEDELMTMVQEASFRYFWEFAHPVSGMARERNTSGDLVTTGGSGFGVMAIIVGIERGFISRTQGRERIQTMVSFLTTADRFHGVWPHWMNGVNGEVIPFSQADDGGDLVETAFMIQGLLTARQYFDQNTTEESDLRQDITQLWNEVEWDWYRQGGQDVLYWHWSPNVGWQMNHQLRGFNEVMIAYILGVASPTHAIPASLYHDGWAGNNYQNANSYFGYPIFVGPPLGGPLFFAHYSYLGFDPRGKRDAYANYFIRNQHHSWINWKYCFDNPKNYEGYSSSCWGLTASDNPWGYLAHEPIPSRDNGTITPTAALGSMPYSPLPSMGALKHFYRELGDRLWGEMGFYDAFNLEEDWFANSYLAIDQGPIIIMLENHRTALLWELFMATPEIQPALSAIGFVSDNTSVEGVEERGIEVEIYPNPAPERIMIELRVSEQQLLSIEVFTLQGKLVQKIQENMNVPPGTHQIPIGTAELGPGLYMLQLNTESGSIIRKFLIP